MGNVCSQGQRLSICVCHAAVLLLVAQLHFTVKPTNWCQAGLQRGEKGMKSAEYHFLFGEGLLTLGKPSPNSMAKTAGTLSRNVRNVKSLICVVTPLESLNLIYWFDVINQFRKQRGESEQSTVARNCRQVSQGQFSWGLEWWCWKKKTVQFLEVSTIFQRTCIRHKVAYHFMLGLLNLPSPCVCFLSPDSYSENGGMWPHDLYTVQHKLLLPLWWALSTLKVRLPQPLFSCIFVCSSLV